VLCYGHVEGGTYEVGDRLTPRIAEEAILEGLSVAAKI
jgi:hypothetical protein